VHEGWTCSLGEVDPLVQACFVPPLAIRRSGIGIDIQDECNSIISHFSWKASRLGFRRFLQL
jgi:hypothetical protein